jgi:hypothetical protein
MRRYEKREVTETRDVLAEDVCDWCGQPIDRKGLQSIHDKDDFECKWETGSLYPEGGWGPKSEVELCRECRPRFFTMLEAQGVKVQRGKWEW